MKAVQIQILINNQIIINMNVFIKIGFLIIAFFIQYESNAKDTNNVIILDSLEIKNMEMMIIIDSIITNERKCDYYSNNLSFGISIFKYGDTIQFSISSDINKDIFLRDSPLGYFCFNGHLFFIKGSISTDLLSYSSSKRDFTYKKRSLPKSKGHTTVIPFFEDDRFTMYVYLFTNNHFLYDSGSPPCPR